MSPTTERLRSYRAELETILNSPLKLRAVICLGALAVWYVAAYKPLQHRIEQIDRQLQNERKRYELAMSIDDLRVQIERFETAQPKSRDSNEIVQYVLHGIRSRPVKIMNLEPKGSSEIGPYKAIHVNVTVEGSFEELDALLRWIETDKRFLRIDQMTLAPPRIVTADQAGKVYQLDMTITGIYG